MENEIGMLSNLQNWPKKRVDTEKEERNRHYLALHTHIHAHTHTRQRERERERERRGREKDGKLFLVYNINHATMYIVCNMKESLIRK